MNAKQRGENLFCIEESIVVSQLLPQKHVSGYYWLYHAVIDKEARMRRTFSPTKETKDVIDKLKSVEGFLPKLDNSSVEKTISKLQIVNDDGQKDSPSGLKHGGRYRYTKSSFSNVKMRTETAT